MAFTFVKRSGDGSQKSFTFSFEGQDEGYIREEDIVATVNGVPASFSLTSSNTLEFLIAPPEGEDNVTIRRVMPKNVPYADFKRGNNFGQEVLNNSFLQLLYLVHELLDGYFPDELTVQDTATFLRDVVVKRDLYVEGGFSLEGSDPSNPLSLVNFREGDKRYKDALENAITSLQDADANLQNQLSGGSPLEASAFSPISWHDPIVSNSVSIPDNKNAWSFGPTMTIAEGQTITIGENSTWTIADGDVNE